MKKIVIQNKQTINETERAIFQNFAASVPYASKNLKSLTFASCDRQTDLHGFVLTLAGIMADDGKKTLLIQGTLSTGDKSEQGLSCYLAGHCAADDILYETDHPNIWLIPAGPAAANPQLLLDGPEFKQLVSHFSDQYDWILIDTAPVTELDSSAIEIAGCSDAAIIVAKDGVTRSRAIRKVKRAVERTGCPVIGCIVVDVKKAEDYA